MFDDITVSNNDLSEESAIIIENNTSSNVTVLDTNDVLDFNNSVLVNNLSVGVSSVSLMSDTEVMPLSLLDGDYTISEIIKQYDNPGIWALGLVILLNVVSKSVLEADSASVEFLQKTTATIRQQIIDQNSVVLDQLNNLIEESGDAYRSGVNRSGLIDPTEPELKWWQVALKWLIVGLAVVVSLFVPGGAFFVFGALLASTLVVSALQLAINIMGSSNEALDKAVEISGYFNVVTVFVDAVFDTIEYFCDKGGILDSELKAKLDLAKTITSVVLNLAIAIAVIIFSVACAPVSGGTSLGAAATMIMNVVNAVNAILLIVNGVFDIVKGVRALEVADIQYTIDMLRNVLETLQSFLKQVQDSIDSVIEHMQMVIEKIGSDFSNAAELIKSIGDTQVGVARAISI